MMPIHVVVGHLAVMSAPIAAVLAVVYAVVPSTRRGVRWPLVLTGVLTAGLMMAASGPGHTLLSELAANGSAAEYEAAMRHAKSSDLATTAAVVVAVLAPLAGWRFLRPDAAKARLTTPAAVVLALAGVCLLAATGYTLFQAMSAAWGVT